MGEKLGQRRGCHYIRDKKDEGDGERQAGRPGGLYFSIAGHGIEHMLFNNICNQLCQLTLCFFLFSPSIPSEKCTGWGGCLIYFCTDEPEAAANLPLRTSAKSPQESCAWLEKGTHKAKVIKTNVYIYTQMHTKRDTHTKQWHIDSKDHKYTAPIAK